MYWPSSELHLLEIDFAIAKGATHVSRTALAIEDGASVLPNGPTLLKVLWLTRTTCLMAQG